MTTVSFTGRINTNNEFSDVATLTGITFTIGNTYGIQIQNIGEVKLADAIFTVTDDKPFNFTCGTDDLYIKTNELGAMLTVLDMGVISSGGGGGGSTYVLPTASTSTLGGVKIDGTSITINQGVISSTVDSTISSSSTNPLQNKVSYPVLSNFIPSNVAINVRSDGTGDFTTIADALTYLEGKWSNGGITLSVKGTFNISSGIVIDTKTFAFPSLAFTGDTVNNTIINYSGTGTAIKVRGSSIIVRLTNFTLNHTGTSPVGVAFQDFTNGYIDNATLNFTNTAIDGITSSRTTLTELGDYINITNATSAIHADQGGKLFAGVMTHSSITNCSTCWQVSNGAILSGVGSTTPTYTNVTNKFSQTVGTATTNGWIARIPS